IDAHLVPCLEQRQPAADRGFRRGVQDRRAGRGAALAAVADAGQQAHPPPPPTAASGEAFRIDGLAGVPLWRPSPTQGSSSTPPFTSRSGGSIFTTSAAPGAATGPVWGLNRLRFRRTASS